MTKKNILFVCASMNVGGAEKSLVNLLNMLDYQKYDISLLLLKKQGAFKEQIPPEVKIIDLPCKAKALYDKVPLTTVNVLLKIVKYLSTGITSLFWKDYDVSRAHRWKACYKKICENLPMEYDTVVAFLSGDSTYFSFDKVRAKRYVTYYHTDIRSIKLEKEIENEYLGKADLIVTISPKCVESIHYTFPEHRSKTVCLENPSPLKIISRLAGEKMPEEYQKAKNSYRVVSVGRLVDIKGYDMVIDAAKILKNDNIEFEWFIVGEGKERNNLEQRIIRNQVGDCVHLMGLRMNPYPYMKNADLLVQSSRYEGKSMVLDEAKILGKQILVTDYNSAKDQIIDGVNGYICEMSAEGIADGVKRAIAHPLPVSNTAVSDDVDDYMRVLLGEDMK